MARLDPRMKFNDAILGLIFLALSATMITIARGFHVPPGQQFGPGFFPTIIGTVMGAAALGLIAKGIVNRATQPLVRLDDWFGKPRLVMHALAVFGILVVYILLSEELGFLVVAPPLLWGLITLLWGRPLLSLLIAAAAAFVIHQFFVRLLLVPLPWGIVPYFQLF